jgi:hypothetical protein
MEVDFKLKIMDEKFFEQNQTVSVNDIWCNQSGVEMSKFAEYSCPQPNHYILLPYFLHTKQSSLDNIALQVARKIAPCAS